MFWVWILIGIFVGAFLGLFFGGLLAAASRGDDLLAAALAQENAARASAATLKPQE
jgi:Na+/H+-dicarboxylate symporter